MQCKQTLPPNGVPTSQQVLASLMAHMPGHVYWKNAQGVYLGCNDRQAQSLGLTHGMEVIGKTDFDLPWDPARAQRFWQNDQQVLLTGLSHRIEEEAIIDGQVAIVLSLKVPLKDNNNQIIGVLGISVDITQQKRMETKLIQAKESLEAAASAKLSFLENMRHDIRTPMAGIRGCIAVIRDYLHKNPTSLTSLTEYVQDLDTSSEALLILLNQVLESIKAADGTLPINEATFNLEENLQQVIQLNQAAAQYKQITLTLQHDRTIPLLVGDAERIQRIVLELMTNAINFTDKGRIKITTRLALQKEHKAIIEITVTDTGMGIPPDRQGDLFVRFKRLTPSCMGQSRGVGLGLSIIQQFVEDLHGEIYFTSELNEGSTFTCILPLKVALIDTLHLPEKTIKVKSSSVSTKKYGISILLVEDDVIVTKAMTALLLQLNCLVDTAGTAKSALSKIKQNKYEIIFMDIGLPDGNGNDITTKIRQDATCINQLTPIIALTAHVENERKKESLMAGMNAVLAKPVSRETIENVLDIFVPIF